MEDDFSQIYRFLRLIHYKKLFSSVKEKPGSLSATEAFSAEIIYLMDRPTVGEFARFIGISQPNASYKVNALATKGYVTKYPCESDKRECRLGVTKKFMDYYGEQVPNVSKIVGTLKDIEKESLKSLSREMAKAIDEVLRDPKA